MVIKVELVTLKFGHLVCYNTGLNLFQSMFKEDSLS